MQTAIPTNKPYRPQIRRVSQRELEDTRNSIEWDTSYGSVENFLLVFFPCYSIDFLVSNSEQILQSTTK